MNVDSGEKSWFIDDLLHIKQQSPAFIDIVDISAVSKNIWLPRCQRGDVLFFSGGDTPYLMRCMNESGFVQELPSLLKSRVYAGISAGSMVTGPSLAINNIDRKIYSEDTLAYSNGETLNVNGLHLVNFYIRPHYNSPDFPGARKEQLEE
jgi:dipeptidase E